MAQRKLDPKCANGSGSFRVSRAKAAMDRRQAHSCRLMLLPVSKHLWRPALSKAVKRRADELAASSRLPNRFASSSKQRLKLPQ